MKIIIPYQTALERHPTIVQQLVEKLRKSKSKLKNDDVTTFQWAYDIWVSFKPYTTQEVFGGKAQQDHEAEDAMTEEEWVQDRVRNVGASLILSKSQCRHSVALENFCPPEMEKNYRDQYRENKKARESFNALSPQEKNAELKRMLGLLADSPGFMKISIPQQ